MRIIHSLPTSRRIVIVTVVFIMILVAATFAFAGYQQGVSSAPDPVRSFESAMGQTDVPADGEAMFSIDEDSGLICVKSSLGRGGGGACTTIDANVPMINVQDSADVEGVFIAVVDPQRRLDADSMRVNGERVASAAVEGEGLFMSWFSPESVDEVVVYDSEGAVIARQGVTYAPKPIEHN